MVLVGHSVERPFVGVETGRNGYFLGDVGSRPVVLAGGVMLVPLMFFPLASDGTLHNPGGGPTSYSHVLIARGRLDEGRLTWESQSVVEGDATATTRGLMEPTIATLEGGRLLMVMRGSNGGVFDPEFQLPSHKWVAFSEDDGVTWTVPIPWTFDDAVPFFSPSAMSTLIPHSSGRIFWMGNIVDVNPQANGPRDPLVMAEVHPETGLLVRETVIELDRGRPDDTEGVNLSHVQAFEDRESFDIVIPSFRYNAAYTSSQPVLYRVSIDTE